MNLVTWVGINDVFNEYFGKHIEKQFRELFGLHEKVYQTGARNFIFFTIPDFERTPCCNRPPWHYPDVLTAGHNAEYLRLRVREWNARLSNHTYEFRTTHPKANVAIYNADTLFNKIMDDPNGYGFIDTTSHCKEEGCMWADTLHPTWGVHRILAADIAHSLNMSTRLTNVLNT
jgi:phospholipase/lecithinase/hemolysin